MSSNTYIPNPSQILDTTLSIKKDMQNMKVSEIDTKYKEFKDKYPMLYSKILSTEDLTELFNMLKLFSKVKSGEMTMDTATKSFGYSMANKYIPEDILKNKKSSK